MLARLADVPPPPGPIASRPVRAGDGTALGLLAYAAYRGSVDDNGEHEAWHVADLTSALEDEYGRLLTPVSKAVPAGDELIAAAVFTWWDDLPLLAFCLTHPDHQGRGLATRPGHPCRARAGRRGPRGDAPRRHRDQPGARPLRAPGLSRDAAAYTVKTAPSTATSTGPPKAFSASR